MRLPIILNTGDTIKARYASIGGFTSGFDYLRIGLAIAVVFQHSVMLTDRHMAAVLFHGASRPVLAILLPAFFALSGFLVSASLLRRPTVAAFLSLRVLRLVPALAVEIFLSALILGPIVTTLPLADYFADGRFWSYFLNILGLIHFNLPGVFAENHVPSTVNGSLWTIPFELECYVALVAVYLLGLINRRRLLLVAIVGLSFAGTAVMLARYNPVYQGGPVGGRALVIAFLAGVAIQLYADKIRLNGRLFALCLAASAVLLLRFELSFVAMPFVAYVTVYIGMLNPKKVPVVFSGDYSYGLYLFAYPLQQLHVWMFPDTRWWVYNAAFTLVFGSAYAAGSWWLVEKPILSKKTAVVRWADEFSLAGRRRLAGVSNASRTTRDAAAATRSLPSDAYR